MAVFPGLFTRTDPRACDLSHSLARPSAGHWFGYDLQGCDYYARGDPRRPGVDADRDHRPSSGRRWWRWCSARWPASTAVASTRSSPGSPMSSSRIPTPPGRASSSWPCCGGNGLPTVTLVLVLFGWPTMTRLMRSAVLAVRDLDYVTAARALGAGDLRLMFAPRPAQRASPPVIVYGDHPGRHRHRRRGGAVVPRASGCSSRPSPGGS